MIDHTPSFSSTQLVELVPEVSYRQADYWARTDVLVPSVADPSGSGRRRLYSFADVVAAKIASELRNAGASLRQIARVVKCVQSAGERIAWDDAKLVVSDSDVVIVTDGNVADTGSDGIVWLVVDLGSVVREVRSTIETQMCSL